MTNRRVSEEEFYKIIGPLDVNPRVDVSTLRERIHVSNWEMAHTRRVIGVTKTDSYGINETEFYLTN